MGIEENPLAPCIGEDAEGEIDVDAQVAGLSLSRTLDSCTRAEAERALQDAFIEEQRRGSSPTAAAAEALRICRTFSRESTARVEEATNSSLPPAPSPTLADGLLEVLDASVAQLAESNGLTQDPPTEKAQVNEDFFSASHRLLLKEQGTASLSST